MIKKFLVIISFVLIISLLLPTFAQAAEAFNVYPILYLPREIEFISSDAAIQDTDENLALLPTNLNEQTLHIVSNYNGENNDINYGVNIPFNFTSDSQDMTSYHTSSMYLMNFEFEIYPLSFKSGAETTTRPLLYNIIRNQGSSDEQIYYPAGFGLDSVSRYQPNADMSLFYKTTYIENPATTDYGYGCYTFHITMVIRLSSVSSLRSLFFSIALSDLFSMIDEAIINIHPATTTKVVLTDLDDIDESIADLHQVVADIFDILSKIEGDNESNEYLNKMEYTSAMSYSELVSIKQELETLVDEMPGHVQDGVQNALDQEKDNWEKEALEDMNNAVEDIQNELNIDISAIQNAFQNLYDSITTHDTNATLTFPAGKVTIGDTEYTFWEEAEIDFTQYFDYPIVQTLLIPLRFVIIIGFGYFMLGQVKKIESIVTMNSGGDDE